MSFGQGGPQWGPGGSQTPDWAALAEASENRNRRRKWLMIGGGALATVAVAAAVAVAVVSANSDNSSASNKPASELPTTADIPKDSNAPDPSFEATTPPPPPDPMDFISSAEKDKAPLSPTTLYPGKTLTSGDRVYKKGGTDSTSKCASRTQGPLGALLTKNKCTRLIRATYSKDGIGVTVGVALFDTAAQASKAKDQWEKGNVTSLVGHGAPTFCRQGLCRSTANSYGRYAYFTTSGFAGGKDVTKKDTKVYQLSDDVARFTFQQINRRGEAQASAAAGMPQ
ncbi:hypothetical protein [Streptomyces sp. NPDC059009]|uniref:hypothetical protein n=1 Tax=Streptomyces sp. NPDC059009 TaxID=3346694 RepID=UPI0036C84A97